MMVVERHSRSLLISVKAQGGKIEIITQAVSFIARNSHLGKAAQ
jgi:hypothetical protein